MRGVGRLLWRTLMAVTMALAGAGVHAQDEPDWARMRVAYAQRDVTALQSWRARVPADHVLRPWLDYWLLSARLPDASAAEVEAFLVQYPDSYVQDRLRNEWMRLLGDRGLWADLLRHHALFRMQDDEDVSCWVALAQWHTAKRWPLAAVEQAWDGQRSKGPGCLAAAQALLVQQQWRPQRVFEDVRKAVEYGRRSEAKALAALVDERLARVADLAIRRPDKVLQSLKTVPSVWRQEAATWAWLRQVKRQPERWADWQRQLRRAPLSAEQRRWVQATLGTWMALAQMPEAVQAFDAQRAPKDDTHAEWRLRAALRAGDWTRLSQWLAQSPQALRAQDTWRYWQARAWQHRGQRAQRKQALALAQGLSQEGGYYGALAQAAFDLPPPVPAAAPSVDAQELAAVRQHPGLLRAVAAMQQGLQSEGVREWHYTIALHGAAWPDERLRAAAQWACELALWDRCINTSLRITGADALARRYPTPWLQQFTPAAQEAEVPRAWVYGLMRQESRFVDVARSSVGASGLMQLMPGTARWMAKRMDLPRSELARWREPEVNVKLGMHYFKHVLAEAGGVLPVAAAAYNAGPARAQRWLPEAPMATDQWVDTIPINETRHYVQAVVHNASVYSGVLEGGPVSVSALLGQVVSAAIWRDDDGEGEP